MRSEDFEDAEMLKKKGVNKPPSKATPTFADDQNRRNDNSADNSVSSANTPEVDPDTVGERTGRDIGHAT